MVFSLTRVIVSPTGVHTFTAISLNNPVHAWFNFTPSGIAPGNYICFLFGGRSPAPGHKKETFRLPVLLFNYEFNYFKSICKDKDKIKDVIVISFLKSGRRKLFFAMM